jgi:hypothetical protein
MFDGMTPFEVVDMRPGISWVENLGPVAVLVYEEGSGIWAYGLDRTAFFSLPEDLEDDAVEIEGDRVTLYNEQGMVIFQKMRKDSDVLDLLDGVEYETIPGACLL